MDSNWRAVSGTSRQQAFSQRHIAICLRARSQLAEPGVLREHRRAFAVQDPLELRWPDAGDELTILLRHARQRIHQPSGCLRKQVATVVRLLTRRRIPRPHVRLSSVALAKENQPPHLVQHV